MFISCVKKLFFSCRMEFRHIGTSFACQSSMAIGTLSLVNICVHARFIYFIDYYFPNEANEITLIPSGRR